MGDKGSQDSREGGHAIQQKETRRGTMGDKGRQDPGEGGHTIQHQGGHLKKALRTPNGTLFGENGCPIPSIGLFGNRVPLNLMVDDHFPIVSPSEGMYPNSYTQISYVEHLFVISHDGRFNSLTIDRLQHPLHPIFLLNISP